MSIENLSFPTDQNAYGLFTMTGMPDIYYRFYFIGEKVILDENFFISHLDNPEKRFRKMSTETRHYQSILNHLENYFYRKSPSQILDFNSKKREINFRKLEGEIGWKW